MDKLIVTEETFISIELKKFEIDEADLVDMAFAYKGLQVNGVEDKEGLKAVRKARLQLKDIRVDISKKSKSLRESAVKFQKAVIARENELIELVEPTERYLEAEEDRIEAEKKRIREEEEKREFERISSMMNQLTAVNFAMDFTELKGLTDEQFATVLQEATVKFNEAEDLRKYEELKENERVAEIERQRKREEERLLSITVEQEKREKALREEQAELARQKAQVEKDKREFQEAIESENRKKEQELMDKKRDQMMEEAKKMAAEKAIQEEHERVKKEAEAKAEQERIDKENLAREEAERPDKEKIQKFAVFLDENIEYPVCSTEKGKQLITAIHDKIQEMATSLYATAKRKRW
jgi:hypothetical protein